MSLLILADVRKLSTPAFESQPNTTIFPESVLLYSVSQQLIINSTHPCQDHIFC